MQLVDVAGERRRVPVVPAGHTGVIVLALLNDTTAAGWSEEERVMIQLVAVLHRGTIDFRGYPACVDEQLWIKREGFAAADDLGRRLSRRRAHASTDKKSQVGFKAANAFLHRAGDRRR